jgi:hypothetical protein
VILSTVFSISVSSFFYFGIYRCTSMNQRSRLLTIGKDAQRQVSRPFKARKLNTNLALHRESVRPLRLRRNTSPSREPMALRAAKPPKVHPA